MRTAGIVCEYNPFHRGHAWHIAETRRALGGTAAVVCVMSGHWTQGADCAVADKWRRAALALEGGADLVLELPLPWALSSAEQFARGAVALLAGSGVVDVLSFGSEAGALDGLERAAACLDSQAYRTGLREHLDRGMPFAAARQAAVRACLGTDADCLSTPNNNLGVEYLRALNALDRPLEAMTIPRRGAAHGALGTEEGFASATQVRRLLRAGARGEAEELLLPGAAQRLGACAELAWAERAVLARLRSMEPSDFAALPDAGAAEGLPRRLYRAARRAESLEAFYALAKTKRYSHARLRRLAVSAFLGLKAADRPAAPPYVRVLGLNGTGRDLLRRMQAACPLPVLTKPAHVRALAGQAQALFALEARATDLYGLCFGTPRPCGLDWTTSPAVF